MLAVQLLGPLAVEVDGVSELEVDDASWLRGRGWALYQAVSALAYYWDTNPGMICQASQGLAQVVADSSL